MKVRVETPSRIHVTLIDLNSSIGRIDGGVGFSLQTPRMVIEVEEFDGIRVDGDAEREVLDHARKAAEVMRSKFGVGARIRIIESYPSHVGLGSGTQTRLGVAKGMCEAHGIRLPVRELARLVGRGGTSGIGVAAFEFGGIIVDGGHRFEEKKGFLPSSASKAPPPPVIFRHELPEDWRFVIAIPKLKGSHGAKEVDYFRRLCPIPLHEVQEVSHIVLMKLMPSVVEGDIRSFGDAINMIQATGFKRREIELQHPLVRELMDLVRDRCYGCGMSSFGPAIYCLAEDPSEVCGLLKEKVDTVLVSHPRNRGAEIRVV